MSSPVAVHDHAHHQHVDHDVDHDHADDVAAWLFDRPISVAAVREREAVLRAGPFAAALPARRTPQGRNVLRWIVQLMAAEAIVNAEASRLGLRADAGRRPRALELQNALELGGVLATVLASTPSAAAVRAAVTAHIEVADDAVRQYYQRNLDQFSRPEARVLSQLTADGRQPLGRVVAGELPQAWERALFAATPGVEVTVAPGRVLLVEAIEVARCQPFDEVAESVRSGLREHAVNAAFASWVDSQRRRWLRLNTGYEHPGDPRQPDVTHHH